MAINLTAKTKGELDAFEANARARLDGPRSDDAREMLDLVVAERTRRAPVKAPPRPKAARKPAASAKVAP